MNIPSSLHLHLNSSHHFTDIGLLFNHCCHLSLDFCCYAAKYKTYSITGSLKHVISKKVPTDLGASSTTFWFLLWIEHSLSFSHRALPCLSASTYKRIKENNSGIGIRIGHKTEVHLKNMAPVVEERMVGEGHTPYWISIWSSQLNTGYYSKKVGPPLKSTRTNVKNHLNKLVRIFH